MKIEVCAVDLANPAHAAALLDLLEHYARDPMGGGQGLAPDARARLIAGLSAVPHYRGGLAYAGVQPFGLINCFLGYSTFAARPLLNIHDVVVHADFRGRGVGQALLAFAERCARQHGCCKLTLEVLSNNRQALESYARAGYAPYELDPAAGQALFLQKKLS